MAAVMRDWQEAFRHAPPGKPEAVENILVPLDGSDTSKVALPVARTLARLFGATLHVLSVAEQAADPREILQGLGLSPEEMHGAVLNALVGDPAQAICRAAKRFPCSLLVMCTHTGGHADTENIGSVAEAVLGAAPHRIALIAPERGREPWNVRRVLLAHDGTPTSDMATAPAADIARRAGAEVIAMHVAARNVAELAEPGSLPAPRYIDQPQHEWPAWANEFLDRMLALGAPPASMNFKLLVTGGQPGSEVAQFARENGADLVVVAWRGRWHEERPGTLKVIVRRSSCPVLLVCAPEQGSACA